MVLTYLFKNLTIFKSKANMENAFKLRQQLDSIITYVSPLLPLANCHMVEFFTHNHWENLLPSDLRQYLDNQELNDATDQFWKCAKGKQDDKNELTKWVLSCQCHCVSLNNDYCISRTQLQEKIKSWGGDIKPEVRIKEFMTSKKSYEVQTMSNLVASLFSASGSTHCVEAGGGKGHLPVALTLAYHLPSLTVDCDHRTITNAESRVKIIQKQWHAIAKKIKDGSEESISESINSDLHRFASAFITEDTDLAAILREKFPEHSDADIRLLLTGLHTCGNLGPSSLRILSSRAHVSAALTVPCCYHLLHEDTDHQLVDVFQRDRIPVASGRGFPMAEHLRGYNLGRNARMLAAQSIDRVVHYQQLPDKSLLYRAMLQVIIKTHLPDLPLSEGKLKGVGAKCKDFKEYFKTADGLLKLGLYDNLPDTYLMDLGKNMNCQWKKIVLFYLVRLCLAQVIENVILLDRLLYLYENGFEKVYLVKLFDPVLSPRCHGIVVVR
ncbi:probable methyltransferase-like protein 25 isoform X1 [Vanessa atalanta]|uniref:probable methyltransferase-like protein 25 isoform X1 n=1 Tax=Vanessa atalanta TaxID=42275 RepID=UPI001FCDE54F|nr:probable methyltransferase-like protein 25 isoform X1 [Vanessa atalanta]